MSGGTPQKSASMAAAPRRKPHPLVIPGLEADYEPAWKSADSRVHPRRSSVGAVVLAAGACARRRAALSWLLGALLATALLLLRALHVAARDRPPLSTVGLPAADAQARVARCNARVCTRSPATPLTRC